MGSDVTVRRLDRGRDMWEIDHDILTPLGLDRLYSIIADNAITMVADDGHQLVGFATVTRGTGPARHAGTLRIDVLPGVRGKGIGKQLMEATLMRASIAGIDRMVATPYLPNDASGGRKVAFFNRHGFTLEGVARKFARLEDGSFVDAALMARVV